MQTLNFSLGQLHFDNRFVRELPADPIAENYRRQVMGAAFSWVQPTPVSNPQLLAAATDVAALLDLSTSSFTQPDFAQVLGGNQLVAGMQPHACCYGGHQFGNWAGQLGDGRAINLGEVLNQRGEHWTLQLKGAGPTPYSRTADGLAVLRSSVREFLCSEAMFHLGVPTTRALSLVLTGEQVRRDMFYDGNAQWEPGAIVCRVAPSFTRFGNFELLAARGDIALLKQLADFTIRYDFPHVLGGASDTPSSTAFSTLTPARYAQWFTDVCTRTAQMVAHWMRVGFVHGVMNTDNMSIVGLTIDYGPYGWLENYDPDWTPNTTDAQGRRYRYSNQPQVALWNLAQLANALYPLIEDIELLQGALQAYQQEYEACRQRDTAHKFGFAQANPLADKTLMDELQAVFALTDIDMTIFYRELMTLNLGHLSANDMDLVTPVRAAYYDPAVSPDTDAKMAQWLRHYLARMQQDAVIHGTTPEQRYERMRRVNPKYVLRNYLAQQAIDQATLGDYSEINRLLDVLRNPYDEQPDQDGYYAKRPEWARTKAGCSMLSCSS